MQQATLDRIREEARALTPVRSLLTLIAALLWALGWVAAKTLGVLWSGVAWAVASVKVGWRDSRGSG